MFFKVLEWLARHYGMEPVRDYNFPRLAKLLDPVRPPKRALPCCLCCLDST